MKLPVYAAGLAIVSGALLYSLPVLLTPPLPAWSSFAFGALVILFASSVGRTIAVVYRQAEERWAVNAIRLRTIAGIVSALLLIVASQHSILSGADNGHMNAAPALTFFLLGLPLLFQVVFNVMSDGLVRATRGVRHVRTRMEALSMSTALLASILALVLRATIKVDIHSSGHAYVATIVSVALFALITVLLSAGPIRGFTRLAARRLK